jgi:hypothetical protein
MKILINSYPRSGTSTFTDAIRLACFNKISSYGEEFFYKDNWIAKSHLPALFLGEFSSPIVIGSIARDPVDAISSNSFRWSKGYTGNMVKGQLVVDANRASKEAQLDNNLKDLINHQIEQYRSYYECLKNGSKNIKVFTYEDTQQKIEKCIDRILLFSNVEINDLDYNSAINVVKNPPMPTGERTNLYYEIRNYISSSDSINICYSLYNEILSRKEVIQ